jgi:very-short-patch-repair endonuclease
MLSIEGSKTLLRRKKPLTRKKALRAKAPLRAKSRPHATETCTDVARKLWPLLAERAGPPFVQDLRIGPWRADFACPAAKLVILLTNGDDPARRDWFEAQGWRVLADPDRVLDDVAAAFTLRIVKH